MRAVEIVESGGPEVLRVVEIPVPETGPGEVRIRVDAAGVNRPDVHQREGHYPPPPGVTEIPGLEVAGEIDGVGPGVERWSVGDRVCALLAGGGYAERCVAPAPQVLPIPDGLDAVTAAAIPETFFTVWDNLFVRGRLSAGEIVLVQGGSGGIGTTAIGLAREFGAARIFATAGGPEKVAALERLGARGIDHRSESFAEVVRAETGGRGVDVILDILGGPRAAGHLELLAPEGRLVVIATLEGREATIDLFRLMSRRATIAGSTLRPRSPEEKGRIARALEAEVWPLLAAGRVAPVIDATFPLEAAADAHRRLESRAHVGKIVLTTGLKR